MTALRRDNAPVAPDQGGQADPSPRPHHFVMPAQPAVIEHSDVIGQERGRSP